MISNGYDRRGDGMTSSASRGFAAHRKATPKRRCAFSHFVFLGVGLALVLLIPLAVPAQARSGSATSERTAETEVRAVLRRWADAVRRRDAAALDRIYADDLFITDYAGATRGKKEEIAILAPSPNTRTLSVTNENVAIRTFPRSNSAVVTALVRMVFRSNGRDSQMAMRYTSLWEKRAGRWQLTVLHTTRIAR